MEKFKTYIASVDGKNGWDVIEPLYNEAFDPDAVIRTADGEFDRAAWATMAQGLVAKRARISELEITATGDDTVAYRMRIDIPGADSMELAATATLRDGRFLRVEPTDPKAYSNLVERSR